MGLTPPTPPGPDPHESVGWAETPVDTVLQQFEQAISGGDLPRARSLLAGLFRRQSLSGRDLVDAWTASLLLAVVDQDRTAAGKAAEELADRLPLAEVRQRIHAAWTGRRLDPEFEDALIAIASDRASAAGGGTSEPISEPMPDGAVQRLLDALGSDPEMGDVGAPDAGALELFTSSVPYRADELRSPLDPDRLRVLMAEDAEPDDDLPYLDTNQLRERQPEEIHRIVSEHPGVSGRDLLRRYALEQARRVDPRELAHSYDLAVELFGQEAFEEAAHLLLPVATVENPERIGALELLARSLYELGRLPQAEAYLKEAIPTDRQVREVEYAPLFYWLGKIAEERGEPGGAIDYYTSAVRLAPDIVEAKRRLRTLLAL